jgi:uncharacterized membrane protein
MKKNILGKFGEGVVLILATVVSMYALYYYVYLSPGTVFPPQHDNYIVHSTSIGIHAGFGGIALLFGAIQFMRSFRKKFPKLNVILRRVYYVSVIISSLAGFYVATYAYGGLSNKIGFTLLDTFWLYSIMRTILADYRMDMDIFRLWIVRNYSLTFAAVTLRLYLPILWGYYGFELSKYEAVYSTLGFLCWAPTVVLIEWFYFSKKTIS